jgi:hypothetical protein
MVVSKLDQEVIGLQALKWVDESSLNGYKIHHSKVTGFQTVVTFPQLIN